MTPSPSPPRAAVGGRRRNARLAAVQALYQIELSETPADVPDRVERVIREFARYRLGQDIDGEQVGEADETLFADIVRGATARRADIDAVIVRALTPDWPIERLEAILRAILRAGAYELLARADVPARVVISEYLEVAHAFFSGKEPALVNGVLDRLGRLLRETELGR
jgi:transcription antitermination protein NusB